jgi:hypothetical protein
MIESNNDVVVASNDANATSNRQKLWESGKLLYTHKEAEFLLNVSDKSIDRLIKRGLLRVNRALRKILITRESIEAFIKL